MENEKMENKAKDEGELSLESCMAMIQELKAEIASMKNGGTKDALKPDAFVEKANVVDEENDDIEEEEDEEELVEMKGSDEKPGDMEKPADKAKDYHGMDKKAFFKEISERDSLAKKLSDQIGVFDHADKTLQEVAEYGIKRLKLNCKKGHEQAVLDGYFAAMRKKHVQTPAMDVAPAKSGSIDAYLKAAQGGK